MFIWSVVCVKNLIVFLFCKTDFTSSILNKQHTQKVNKLLKHVTAKSSYHIVHFISICNPPFKWCIDVPWLKMSSDWQCTFFKFYFVKARTFLVVAFIQYIQRKQALWKYCCIKNHVSYVPINGIQMSRQKVALRGKGLILIYQYTYLGILLAGFNHDNMSNYKNWLTSACSWNMTINVVYHIYSSSIVLMWMFMLYSNLNL